MSGYNDYSTRVEIDPAVVKSIVRNLNKRHKPVRVALTKMLRRCRPTLEMIRDKYLREAGE